MSWIRIGMMWMIGLGLSGCLQSSAEARELRMALLVANQQGWKKDPLLRYVIQGDLRPLARSLRRIGFKVKILENRDARAIRDALRWFTRRSQSAPRISTFLFYYSGHADRKHFHTGARKKHPLTYREFSHFLKNLSVRRRIAMIDACYSGEIIRQFGSLYAYKQLVGKGIRRVRQIDLSQSFPNQSRAEGLQIITSSLDLSWESKTHRASIFTHYLLEGIDGPADQNHDGKISVNELFDYVSVSMHREIKQQPVMFGVIKRSGSYALAPAYQSRLRIGSAILGRLQVSVDNFYWSRHKRTRRPLSLATIPGKGLIQLQRKGRCWQQQLHFVKGQEVQLQNRWKPISCRRTAHSRKGMLELPARLLPEPSPWQIELQGGLLHTPLTRGALLAGGRVGLRHEHFALQLGMWGTSVAFEQTSSTQLLLQLQFSGGFRQKWQAFDLFAGGFVGLDLLIQDVGSRDLFGTLFRYGASIVPSLWLSERWALHLQLEGGFLVGLLGDRLQHLFSFSAALGLRVRF